MVLCNQQAREANILDLQQGQRLCVPAVNPVFPAGLNCFNSKVFSFNILVSDELVFATGQQLFDPETQDGQFVSNPNVKHQSWHQATPLRAKGLLARGGFR